MSTAERSETLTECRSADVLLRCRRGCASDEELQWLEGHRKLCKNCRTDDDSLKFLSLDVLMAKTAYRELEAFSPSREHARYCRSMTGRLDELAHLDEPPELEVRQHFDACCYCRQRVILHGEKDRDGRLSLRGQLLEGLLNPVLSEAATAVAWELVPDFRAVAEFIRAKVSAIGQALVTGLDEFLCPPAPAYAVQMGSPTSVLASPLSREEMPSAPTGFHWEIPVPKHSWKISLDLEPKPEVGVWSLRAAIITLDDPRVVHDATLTIQRPGQIPLVGNNEFALWANRALPLKPGSWQIVVRLGKQEWTIPLELEPLSEQP